MALALKTLVSCSLFFGIFATPSKLQRIGRKDTSTFNEEEILRTLLIDQKLSTIPNYSPELNDIEQTKLIHYIVEGSNEIKGMYIYEIKMLDK